MLTNQNPDAAASSSMSGKTVVITGATSGIGQVGAEALAAKGARLVLIGRDRARLEATLQRIGARNPDAEHSCHLADLSSLAEMKRVAAEVAAAEPRIDVLVNNAGAIFQEREITADGLERTFATNHLAYVVLTLGLAASLNAARSARVVNTASAAHRASSFDPGDPQSLHNYNPLRAYGRSKLYNILVTRELARRWQPAGVTVNCFHPGFVATRFGDGGGSWLAPVVRLCKLVAVTPEKGARTLVYLASSPEVAGITGQYFSSCKVATPRPAARDDQAATKLWVESLRLAGLDQG